MTTELTEDEWREATTYDLLDWHCVFDTEDERDASWAAFLTRVRRAAKAEAWREYADALEAVPDYAPTEYDKGRVDQRHATIEELHARADECETGDRA